MQTSFVFDQRTMPGAGDVDDCGPTAAMQCQNVCAPWLRIVSIPAFRAAAGVPDRPGKPDGFQIDELYTGQIGVAPVFSGLLHKVKGWSWDDFADMARAHHPMAVSVISGKLPANLQYGFKGYHQVSVVVKGSGRWLFANPLAKPQSRWVEVNPTTIRDAIMAYGKDRAGTRGAWALAYPTDDEMATTFLGSRLEGAYAENERLEAELGAANAKIEAAKEALA